MKQKKIVYGAFILVLALLTLSFASAATTVTSGGETITKEVTQDYSFLTTFIKSNPSLFSTFSIVGDARGCGSGTNRIANKVLDLYTSDLTVSCSQYGYSNCLIDVFASNSNYDYGEALAEAPIDVNLGASSPRYWKVELYSCPHPECTSNSQCVNWYGSGSTCESSNQEDSRIPYIGDLPWKYCSGGNDLETVDCWFVNSNNVCEKRTYSGQSSCPATYQGFPLYSSNSDCQQEIPIIIGPGDGLANGANCNQDSDCSSNFCDPRGLFEQAICATRDDGNGDGDGGGFGKTLTYTEFYSVSDADFLGQALACNSDSSCPAVEGSTSKCLKTAETSKAIYNSYKSQCSSSINFGIITGIPNLISKILTGDTTCGLATRLTLSIKNLAVGEPGICVAESNSSVGKVWGQALKMVAGLGLPRNYVMLTTIIAIALLLFLLLGAIRR
jgi:hypothetical protein